MLDGIEPELIPQLTKIAQDTKGVAAVGVVRARWLGHRLIADLTLAVPPTLTVGSGHEIAKQVQARIQEQLPHVASVTVHMDPIDELGEEHHGPHEH